MPWEKPTPHHKWADELEAESKAKSVLRKAKLAAKKENHGKECPYCHHSPVSPCPQHPGLAPDHPEQRLPNSFACPKCNRIYATNCPGTILLHGNQIIVEVSEHK